VLLEALNDGLNRYQIGPKLRALRLRRKMGLVELGRQTGLSSAMLSKVERGRLFPTLPTLYRMASVFGVGLDHFFGDVLRPPIVAIVRKNDRLPPSARADGRLAIHRFESIEFAVDNPRLNMYHAEFDPRPVAPGHRHTHLGFEVLFVITGRVSVSFDDAEYVLEQGDAIYFDSERPHGYRRQGHDRCTALIVTTTASD
jgi:transcriptional regulator with XRE-family HTH domain